MKSGLSAALLMLVASASCVHARDIAATAKSDGHFTILLQAATAAGMASMLDQPGPYTVFAPTDAAFKALPAGMLERLMKPENKDELKKILGYHVLFGRLATSDLAADKSAAITTIGQPVILERKAAGLMVNDATLAQPDIAADNGVIQVIDKVLIPPCRCSRKPEAQPRSLS